MKKNDNNIRDAGIVDATAAGILQIFCGHYRNVDAITCYLYNQQILWRRHPYDWSYATLRREKWNLNRKRRLRYPAICSEFFTIHGFLLSYSADLFPRIFREFSILFKLL